MAESSQSRTYVVVGAIAAVVIAVGLYLYAGESSRAPSTAEQPMTGAPAAPGATPSPTVPTTPTTPGTTTPGSTQ